METTAEEDWNDIVPVNLKSVYAAFSRHAIPAMRGPGEGIGRAFGGDCRRE